jgi:uncharacterized protein
VTAAENTNRLARETSPYLLQHAHNPVDWYPWGEEAFAAARERSKPILLSVGYSACHWCHVMEHESFENEEIAALMNSEFVNVKVDREERPDVDEIYMGAVQLLTGRGGWPMTVFLTPDGEPFYGGTYYPPTDRHGMPGFPRVLTAVAEAWRERPDDIKSTVGRLLEGMKKLDRAKESDKPLDASIVARAADQLAQGYDRRFGGLGRAPKFPNTMAFALFLRVWEATGRRNFLDMTTHTLTKMAEGGIYDHLGGGFHRYSVDERWLVPHFEKMLYDNSQLAPLYLDAYRASGEAFFAEIARGILDYVLREMTSPEGGFYATQDADSEGVEGKFFVWTKDEVVAILGEDAAEIFCRVYDVTPEGNFEHANILHRTLTDEQAAKMFQRDLAETTKMLAGARQKLFEVREERVKPFRDEKIVAAWNGLIISAFAKAYALFDDEKYRAAAERALTFIDAKLWQDGRLRHVFKDGEARVPAFLDDVAALGLGSLDLFEATSDPVHLGRAEQLARIAIEGFWDEREGGFFFTPADHEKMIVRTKPAYDGSVPSGNSLAADLLLRLHHWTGDATVLEKAERVLKLYRDSAEENPFAHANLLAVIDLHARGPEEVVVVANGGAAGGAELLRPVRRSYRANRFVFAYDPAAPPARLPPFATDKPMTDGRPTAYVCRGFTCSAPATTWDELQERLAN